MSFGRSRRLALTLSAAVVAGLTLSPAPAAFAAAPTDLLISEYVEGSSNNKAVEIYNGTGSPVDLAAGGYAVQMYFNGNTAVGTTVNLTGTVAPGDVFVLAQSSANAAILAVADQTSNASFFNGDDAITLTKSGATVDSFGQIGVDPGTEWTGGGADDTLRRKSTVCAGDADPSDAFDATVQWDAFATNEVSDLGQHTAACGDTGGPTNPTVLINEVDADTPGTDAAEFVELVGPAGTDLTGLSLVLFNGNGDTSYGAFDLDGQSLDENGYFVLCGSAAAVTGCDLEVAPATNLVQNGADAVALYRGDASTFPNGTAVTSDNLVDALVYGTSDPDDAGLLPLLNAGQPQVDDSDVESMQRCPDASGGARNSDTYTQSAPTPAAENCATPPPPALTCTTGDITPIHDVQGAGATSPLVGQDVAVEGVVTGVFPNLSGLYVQSAPSAVDADPATSEGVFVFGSAQVANATVGTTVRVAGQVAEYTSSGSSMTEIKATDLLTCDTATTTIDPVELSLPLDAADALERVEGMLVTWPQDLTISEYFNYDRFGEVVLRSDRLFQPTSFEEPGPATAALLQQYALDAITVDDGSSAQNPDPAVHPGNGEEFTLNNRFRGGDTITGITGVIDETFGLYRVQPTTYGTYAATNPRSAAPDPVGGDVKVASFNVLNYFTTLDAGGAICGPQSNQDCRGANTAVEFDRQRAKIIAAIKAIDAGVVGLTELENHPSDAAIDDLVQGLNDATAPGTYAAIETGPIGSDAIRVGLIYQPAKVTPSGDFAVLDSTVDPRFDDTKNRPALAQTFADRDGATFTVAINHLKSKGSSCDSSGDPDTGTGAGNCNLTRTRAAAALVDWLEADPTDSGDSDYLLIGDLNSYDEEDPIDAIKAGADDTSSTADDYTDLVEKYQGESSYSYLFDGLFGDLDYALASSTLTTQVTGATVWHVNADEPDILDYNVDFKKPAQAALYEPNPYRASDHDPVVVGLDLTAPTFPMSVKSGLLVSLTRRLGTATLTASLDTAAAGLDRTMCPARLTLTIDGKRATAATFRSGRRVCVGSVPGGSVTFSPGDGKLILHALIDPPAASASHTFAVEVDDTTFVDEVRGKQLGLLWWF